MSRKKQVLIRISFIIFVTSSTFADWKDDAQAIDVSGGENHSLVLTKDNSVWTCGPNGEPIWHTYYSVLGTGSTLYSLVETTLAPVRGRKDVNYLEDINDVDADGRTPSALT